MDDFREFYVYIGYRDIGRLGLGYLVDRAVAEFVCYLCREFLLLIWVRVVSEVYFIYGICIFFRDCKVIIFL